MVGVLDRLRLLRTAPRELWLVYGLKMLESFAYFSSSLNLAPYLTTTFGFSDLGAGAVYSAWGVTAGVVGMAVGPLIDRLGVRNSLVVGGTLLTLGRAMFAAATTRSQMYVSLFLFQSVGMTLGIPVMSIAIKRVTTDQTRTTAYGLFYSAMNVAALVAGLGTDAIRSALGASEGSVDETRALRGLFWVGAAVSAVYTLIALVWFRPVPVPKPLAFVDDDEELAPETRSGCRHAWSDARETFRDRVFWRLVGFSGVIFGARSIFRHMDATLPKWMEREIGPMARYGTVYAINPAIIIVAVPILQARLADIDPYACVIVGTVLTTLAPFALAALPASYSAAVLFMLLLSAGEATYSPLLYSYVMALSPPGREGIYGTLAAAPLFLVKVIAGTAGGELLGLYCPATGTRRCQLMWFIIGCTSATTPVGLLMLRRWLYSDDVRQRIRSQRDRERPKDADLLVVDEEEAG